VVVEADGAGGGVDARADRGHSQAVGFFLAAFGFIARRCRRGERGQLRRNGHEPRGHGELARHFQTLLVVIVEHHARLARGGIAQHIAGHKGVAVAVAADPAAHLNEIRQFNRLAEFFAQARFQVEIQARQFAQESTAEIGDAVFDFIAHCQLEAADFARLPQGQDFAGEGFDVFRFFFGRHARAVALHQNLAHRAIGIEHGFAFDFGRVRGQYRRNQRLAQHGQHFGRRDAALFQVNQYRFQTAGLRTRALNFVDATPAVVVHVLGDIGQVREITESAHKGDGRVQIERRQFLGQGAGRFGIAIAHITKAQIANACNLRRSLGAGLFVNRVRKQVGQQIQILFQRQIFFAQHFVCSHGAFSVFADPKVCPENDECLILTRTAPQPRRCDRDKSRFLGGLLKLKSPVDGRGLLC